MWGLAKEKGRLTAIISVSGKMSKEREFKEGVCDKGQFQEKVGMMQLKQEGMGSHIGGWIEV